MRMLASEVKANNREHFVPLSDAAIALLTPATLRVRSSRAPLGLVRIQAGARSPDIRPAQAAGAKPNGAWTCAISGEPLQPIRTAKHLVSDCVRFAASTLHPFELSGRCKLRSVCCASSERGLEPGHVQGKAHDLIRAHAPLIDG